MFVNRIARQAFCRNTLYSTLSHPRDTLPSPAYRLGTVFYIVHALFVETTSVYPRSSIVRLSS